jgi:hypothetical protein
MHLVRTCSSCVNAVSIELEICPGCGCNFRKLEASRPRGGQTALKGRSRKQRPAEKPTVTCAEPELIAAAQTGSQPPAPAPASRSKQLVRCQECSSMVRADRIARHRKRVHRRVQVQRPRPPKAKPKRSRAAGGTAGWKAAARRAGRERLERRRQAKRAAPPSRRLDVSEQTLDGSGDFWWFRRERGRFGSHVSHDDYGEDGAL